MPLAPETLIGPYRIIAPLGAGGMGEVYRARDERLGRDVAIKALPAAFARDSERLARFEREAKLLAALNHPNVGSIYGLEEADGNRYLVLELVDGQTLAERLAQGALPGDEALDVCRQVAAALEAAHESGIIHRDLKPGNVMLTPSGTVKVLDFGLAKEAQEPTSGTNLASSPTMTQGLTGTGAGVILGTAAFMSPEQARGKAVDKRTDIWSFGCVLYECLTGRPCFRGETVSDLIAQILQGEPNWEALPARTPNRVVHLLRRCLEKDARRRLRDIGDARLELEDVLAQNVSGTSLAAANRAAAGRPNRLLLVGLGAALVAVSVLGTIGVWSALHRTPPPAPVRFEVAESGNLLFNGDGSNSALSPDGTMLVFVAGDTTSASLWLRSLETLTVVPLAGTDGAELPFWSPDSRMIGFFARGKLKRIPAAGGAVLDLCDLKNARGGTWSEQDVILCAPAEGPVYRVPASGGDPVAVTTLDSTRGEIAHRFPQFLPDGRHFLYSSLPPRDGKFDIYVGSIDSPARELVTSAGSGVRYAEPGYLLSRRNSSLVAQPFDAGKRRLHGTPVTIRESITPTDFSGGPAFSVSANGRLSYATLKIPDTRLAWFDSQGREIAKVPIDPAPYAHFQLSPDDRRVALVRRVEAERREIWLGDLERGVVTRFSEEPINCTNPHWSPDGTRIAYDANESGPQAFVVRSVTGPAETRTLLASDRAFKRVNDWTPDGRALVFEWQDPATYRDLWVLPLEGDEKPRLFLKAPAVQNNATISRDGRWIAYDSNESGQNEAYVQPFPGGGLKYQVTKGGGVLGGWFRGGTQLVFGLNANPTVYLVADVLPGDEFRLGPARTFFILPRDAQWVEFSDDGSRFLALVAAEKPAPRSFTVVL